MSKHGVWAPYVARAVAEQLRDGVRAHLLVPHAQRAVVAFVDVAGFTRLSELLAPFGRSGAEALSDLLNAYYTDVIDCVHRFGGDVISFAGDALAVMFPVRRGEEDACRAALQACVELQLVADEHRAGTTVAGDFELTTKVGAALGDAAFVLVGSEQRWVVVEDGDALAHAVAGEKLAAAGEIVVHDSLLAAVGGAALLAQRRGPYQVLLGLREETPAGSTDPPLTGLGDEQERALSGVVHETVAARLAAGDDQYLDEHRDVTVLFAEVEVDAGSPEGALADMAGLVHRALPLVERAGGYLVQAGCGDKGARMVAVFGAPQAHEDDVGRALTVALDVAALPGPPRRVGVQKGQAFCGHVGSRARREYTVLGDVVNTAARLAAEAEPGTVCGTRDVRDAASRHFVWADERLVALHGRVEPLLMYRLVAEEGIPAALEPSPQPPLVGRAHELLRLRRALDRAAGGAGSVLVLAGEPGIGKSRLAAETVQLARRSGFLIHEDAFRVETRGQPLRVWRHLLGSLLPANTVGPAGDGEPSAAGGQVASPLADRLTLLASLLGLSSNDSSVQTGLDPRTGTELFGGLLLDYLRAVVTPVLVVLEDVHWMDALSQQLLAHLARNLQTLGVLIVLTTRGVIPEEVAAEGGVELIDLGPLDDADSARLVAHLPQPGDRGRQEVVLRGAGGNPLLLQLLAELGGGGASGTEAAPGTETTLRRFLQARLDRLPSDVVQTLREASVWRGSLSGEVLERAFALQPKPGAATRGEALEILERSGFLVRSEPQTYVFRHDLLRDVVYHGMGRAVRRQLHEQAGKMLEREQRAEPGLLADHFAGSGNALKLRRYAEEAGDAAVATHDLEAAATWYGQAVGAAAAAPTRLLLKLGDVQRLTGRAAEAEASLRRAAEIAEGEDRIDALVSLGTLLAQRDDTVPESLRLLYTGRREAMAAGRTGALGQALDRLAYLSWHRGDRQRALAYSREQLRVAEGSQDLRATAAALNNLALIQAQLGQVSEAIRSLRRAIALGRELGDLVRVVHASNDLAMVCLDHGLDDEAGFWLQEGVAVASRIGYRRALAHLRHNEAELRRRQGDLAGARVRVGEALRSTLELGRETGGLDSLELLAELWADEGRVPEAGNLFRRVTDLARAHESPDALADYLFTLAAFQLEHEGAEQAGPTIAECLELALRQQREDLIVDLRLLQLRAAHLLGDQGRAEVREALEQLAGQVGDERQAAAVSYEIWRTDPTAEGARADAAERYRGLYEATPRVQYWQRHGELTGHPLPVRRSLPPVTEAELREAEPTTEQLLDLARRLQPALDQAVA